MHRRDLLKAGLGAVSLLALQTKAYAAPQDESLRVALVGCGWYGKTDLLHLLQVAPEVEVVGLCDVDRDAAGNAAEIVSSRQASKKSPPTYGDYRKLLA